MNNGDLKKNQHLQPLISIVTVVFNAENLIEESILSVINQNYKNIEYIIIDGGSKDNTVSVIKKYEPHITYWISEPDEGIYDAMNKAINIAKGEWINFMNAGDVFCKNSIISKIFNRTDLDEFSFIYGSHYWQYLEGKKTLVKTNDLSTMWQRIAFSHQSLFSRTSLMKKYKFNLSYDVVSDYEFYFHSYMKGHRFLDVGFPVATVLAGGYSDTNFMKRTVERWAVVIKYKDENHVNRFYFNLIKNHLDQVSDKQSVNSSTANEFEKKYNSDNYKVSVIIPNYNNEKYLDECINSVLDQTHKNIEIIIVDDCSTDKSVKKLKKYQGQYDKIKLILNEVNQGVSKNRHTAILQSSGDFITTLDSDDYFIDKNKLKSEVNLILKYRKNKQNIIAFSNIVLIDENKNRIGYQANKNIKQGNIFYDIITRDCMIPRDFMFTREMYLNVGCFDFNIPIYEDWDLKIRLASKYHFYHVDIDGIGYRRHGNGLSSAPMEEHKKWLEWIYLKNFHLIGSDYKKMVISKKVANFIN